MDSLDLLKRTVAETDTIIESLDESQLALQTPCAEWKVADLLDHITGGATMFAISAEKGSVTDEDMASIDAGADRTLAWKTASRRALAAFEQPGVMDKLVTLPFGEMPAGIALNIAVFDVATHLCDLASTVGTPVRDSALLEDALAIGKQMIGPELRAPGVFDAEQPCADDAPVATRLLAFAGRAL